MALSQPAIQQLTSFLEAECRVWVAEYIAGRKSRLRRSRASGALSDSLAAEISSDFGEVIRTSIDLMFEQHGRYLDMRRLQGAGGGADYVEEIAAWIVERGFEQRFVRAFVRKYNLKKPPADVLNRIAWGIVKSREKNYRRRSPWYVKSRAAAVEDLYNRVSAGIPDIVVQELMSQFNR
jgi:hypothetical protein